MKEESKLFLSEFIENQKCSSCPISEECDKYEEVIGYKNGRYESLCEVFTKIVKVEG